MSGYIAEWLRGPFNLVYEVRPQARPQVVPGTALCPGAPVPGEARRMKQNRRCQAPGPMTGGGWMAASRW